MKKFLLFVVTAFSLVKSNAQFSQNFDGSIGTLTGNCWSLTGVSPATNSGDIINGTGSLISVPPAGNIVEIMTPALKASSNTVQVSFNYKLSSGLNNNATRYIEIGVLTQAGTYTALYTINMDHNTPTTVQNFNQNFILASAGKVKLVIRGGGTNGDGSSRLIFDDVYTSAMPLYGTGTCNSAPVAVNDNYFSSNGATVNGNVLNNDSEPNEENMNVSLVTGSPNATITLNANGSFSATPNPGYAGPSITFTYQITDDGFSPMTSNTATVTITLTAGTLPVKLTSFTATLNNNKADLKWTTSSEMNVSHFVIEKSTNGSDFSDAGIVFAAGNSSIKNDYAFSDNVNATQDGLVYYRLRSVDIDGKNQYSETRIIRLGKVSGNMMTISSYPNPVTSELRVMIPNEWQNKKVVYELFNNNGQVAKKVEAASSNQVESIRVDGLASGLYIIRATCNGQVQQQKIVKQ